MSVRPFESCKKRWCPVCAWRKSLKQWALLVDRLPALIEQHGPVRWLLLTLTVRNCTISDLKGTVDAMQRGFRALTNSKTKLGQQWPAQAWLKALEVTFPREGEAHPHFHCLLAVRPSYFKKGYVSQAEWVARWRKAMKLDYDPIVDVRRVKALGGISSDPLMEALGGLREVAKYVTKPADLQNNPDGLRGLLALKHTRFVDGGGWLRGVLRDDQADEQLELPDVEDVATFWWRAVEMQYRRKC
ncbi:protein rep [Chloroflexus sp.]|uniref:protein rep n=1 Tax=Chloroflexus sp. TaxID=1904827 RepID=UPI002ACD65AA|nr:protein rep [Chloroflexus sp.]